MSFEHERRRRDEEYFQAVTWREPNPRKQFSPHVFVTGYTDTGVDQLLQHMMERHDIPTGAVKNGLLASRPEVGAQIHPVESINPMHYVVVLRDPLRTYASGRKLSFDKVMSQISPVEGGIKSKVQIKTEREIEVIRHLQKNNLEIASQLSFETGAGLSVLYLFPEKVQNPGESLSLLDKQAAFLAEIVKSVGEAE